MIFSLASSEVYANNIEYEEDLENDLTIVHGKLN